MTRREMLAVGAAAATLTAIEPALALPPTAQPMLAPWTGPYGGLAPFDKIKTSDFIPAFNTAMEEGRAEIAKIASDPRPATFANTIAAMEDSGRHFGRALSFYGIYTSTMNDDAMQKVEEEMSPKIAAYFDEVTQNGPLFQRIKTVYETRNTARLNAEQKRLAEVYYKNFARQGAALDETKKKRLGEINQQLAALYTKFSQNQQNDEGEYVLWLESQADLAGLSESQIAAAAALAKAKGRDGKWAIANTRSAAEPFLTYSTRRDLREKCYRMWMFRGDNPGERDNKKVIPEILKLRTEKANLLGFPTHAHWIVDNGMAKKPEATMDLMLKLWEPAKKRVAEEVADMQKIVDAEGGGFKIDIWDYRFYAEKVRKVKYDFDESEVKPYLVMENMRDAMFWMAQQLFGMTFKPISGVPVYHPDVAVWEVVRGGRRIGLYYFDPYAREGKNSGAWMNEYRTQERFKRPITPIVSNNCNYVRGVGGEPTLISWDDAETLFHEFGHALHGLSSNVTYPTLAGTNVARDYVEFPSQVLEYWVSTPEVLNKFARHYKTGEPMPQALLEKINRAKTFNQGFKTVEFMASALYDMRIHLETKHPIDPAKFERDVLNELGLPKEIVMRHRPTAFGHIFSGDGYSAGYYSYLWADTLTADAWEAFLENGGPYNKAMAKKLVDNIFSVGNTIDPAEAYRRFRGRDPDVAALLRDRGFAT
jgi:peptidyl-dipeptidase Dcp